MNESPLSSGRQKKLSLSMIADAFRISIERFPVSSLMILLTTVWFICYIECTNVSGNIEIAMNFVLPMSCLLSLAVSVWCRAFSFSRKKEAIAQIITGIVLTCDLIYLLMFGTVMSATGWTGHIAAAAAGIVAVLFIPSCNNVNDKVSWMFTNLQLSNFFATACISLGMLIVTIIIGETIDTLLVKLSYKVYATAEVLLCFTLCSFILLSRIPSESGCISKSETYEPAKFRIGLTKFMILPVALVYMAILYIYGLKILFLWKLPDGMICWSVTGLALAVLFVLFLLEALRKKGVDRYTALSLRLLPWLMLPLLAMMSVAIGYRINQYGITPPRLYVVVFNIWAYAVFIYLGCRKEAWGLNRVAISFAVVFLVTSIFPGANLTTASNRYMQSVVKNKLSYAGIKSFPADRETFAKAYESLDRKSKRDIYEKLNYLDSWKNHDLISDIISFPVHDTEYNYYVDPIFQPYLSDIENDDIDYSYRFQDMDQYCTIPDGYTKFREISKTIYDIKFENETIVVKDGADSLILDIRQLERLKNRLRISLRMPADSLTFVPEYINITVSGNGGEKKAKYCFISGYIFKK